MASLFEEEARKDFEFSVATVEVTYLRGLLKNESDIIEFEYLLRQNGYHFVRNLKHDKIYARKGFV